MIQSHSQFGEDSFCAENLKLPSNGIYIEVGAFDGRLCSNSLWLEERGWDGFICEADPVMASECRKNRKCHVFECACGKEAGTAMFHVNKADRGMSGLSVPGDPIEVIVQPLSVLIASRNLTHIDFLSVDTEGTEDHVWAGIGTFRPDVVILEYRTDPSPPKDEQLVAMMKSDGYCEAHRTYSNLIFTRA